jgi:hypothetical protein
MSNLALTENRIPAMSQQAIDRVRELEAALLTMPQIAMATEHVLHGGLYSRTICVPAGVVLTGAFIQVPTLLIVNGDATVNTGEGGHRLTGHHVLAASAGRRQAFLAHADTYLTMVFATQAKTVAEAEDEFTNEAHLLISRSPEAVNKTTITGE